MALRDFFLNQSVNEMFPNRLPGTAKGWDESSVNREVILDPDVPVTTEVLPSMAVKLSGRQGQMFWVEPCTTVADEVFGFVIYKAKNVINRITRNQMATVARHMQLMDFVFKTAVTAGQAVYQDPVDHYCTTNSADGVYVGVAMETIPATATFPTIATVEIQLAAGASAEGGVTEEWVKNNFINADASTYVLETLDELFSNSNAKLAKVYNEPKMPAMGAFTVLSLGWTYTDSENEPTLLATDLETGEFYYYHGSLADCTPDAWQQFSFGGGSGEGGLPSQTGHTGFLQTDGTNASWSDKEALVNETTSFQALAIGNKYAGTGSTVIGVEAATNGSNHVVLGSAAECQNSDNIAIGRLARVVANHAMMINLSGFSTTNTENDTVKIANSNGQFTIMSANGTIPSERLAADGTSGQVLSKTDTGMAWVDAGGSASGSDNNGLEGDYATTYGIVDETTSGLPYIKAVGSTVVVIPAGLVVDVPGQSGLTTVASAIEYEVQSTNNPTLFLAQGSVIEAEDVFFQQEEPDNGTTSFAAWWNGTTWQFKSNDTGNVWRPANAVRIAKTVFTGTSLTRLCFTGCRVLNKQEFATKESVANLNTSVTTINDNIDSIYEELGEKLDSSVAATTYATPEYVDNGIFPSDKYVDLAPASLPYNYVAPANGYILVAKETSTGGKYLLATVATQSGVLVAGQNSWVPAGAGTGRLTLPVKKGDTVTIASNLEGTLELCRFVYARNEGE